MIENKLNETGALESLLQIYGTINPEIIDALLQVNRSIFLPDGFSGVEYSDVNFPCYDRFVPNFYASAFMLQISQIYKSKNNRVLVIGSNTGYLACILSFFSKEVICLEVNEELLDVSKNNLLSLQVSNTRFYKLDSFKDLNNIGNIFDIKFDFIFVEGAINEIPNNWKQVMNEHTVLIGSKKANNVGQFFCAKLIKDNFVYKEFGISNLDYLLNMNDTDRFIF